MPSPVIVYCLVFHSSRHLPLMSATQFTLSENMKKLRIWVGVRAVVYEDYRLFITMFPSDVLVGDFGETVPEDGTYTHTFGGTVPFVYTMQHTSTVYR